MSEIANPRSVAPGLISGAVFFTIVLAGCGYIIFSKLHDIPALYVTLTPVAIMIAYAALLGFARLFRLRDDQSGDNLYYMGFLFTLTSLGVSLYQYSSLGSAEQIVQNFGIAIASTIAGIALRIFFNQMRRDPVEVEHFARLELAEASRKVKRELESTVLEFAYFRRATQQSITDSLEEMKSILGEARTSFTGQLKDFVENSSEPLEQASRKSGDTIDGLSTRITKTLNDISSRLADQSRLIADSSNATVQALDAVVTKLKAMQTPEQVIEIKLNPAIQGLSRAVNNFTKSAEAHAQTIADNVKETQKLTGAASDLLNQARAEASRPMPTFTPVVAPAPEPESIPAAPPSSAPFRGFFTRTFSGPSARSDNPSDFSDKR
ncbi:hypothetical protein [Pseudolabrys sp.]|uniref:hypothetical protein n=1 Tax=Pseudolabrys sp. TaxID=1960880 RepID=UPI003D0DBEF5